MHIPTISNIYPLSGKPKQIKFVMKNLFRILIILFITCHQTVLIYAQNHEAASSLTQSDKKEITEWVCRQIEANYVDSVTAREMAEVIHSKSEEGDFDQINSLNQFTRELQTLLQEVSEDLHIRVNINKNPPPTDAESQRYERSRAHRPY